MKTTPLIIIAVSFFIFIIGIAVFALPKLNKTANVKISNNAQVEVVSNTHDWGEIGINNGKVEHVFDIKNTGNTSLSLFNISTSCMCTTAQIILDDNQSQLFGMHESSDYVAEVLPGKTANLKMVFDPAFHGPNGTGPITRQVIIKTNSQDQPQLEFNLTALVTR